MCSRGINFVFHETLLIMTICFRERFIKFSKKNQDQLKIPTNKIPHLASYYSKDQECLAILVGHLATISAKLFCICLPNCFKPKRFLNFLVQEQTGLFAALLYKGSNSF